MWIPGDISRRLRPSACQVVRPSPPYSPPVEEAPDTGRWVALPILCGVGLGLMAVVCSLVAVLSPGLAPEVFIVALGLIVLVWLLGHLLTKQDDAKRRSREVRPTRLPSRCAPVPGT